MTRIDRSLLGLPFESADVSCRHQCQPQRHRPGQPANPAQRLTKSGSDPNACRGLEWDYSMGGLHRRPAFSVARIPATRVCCNMIESVPKTSARPQPEKERTSPNIASPSDAKSATPDSNSATHRTCSACLQPKPVEHFRFSRKSKGERHTECRACHAIYSRLRNARKREANADLRMFRVWSSFARADERRLAVYQFAAELIQQFGGPSELAKEWKRAHDEASALRRIRSIDAMVKLTERLQRDLPALTDPQQMTTEELEREQKAAELQVLQRAVKRSPKLVAALLRQAGFTITPPSPAGD